MVKEALLLWTFLMAPMLDTELVHRRMFMAEMQTWRSIYEKLSRDLKCLDTLYVTVLWKKSLNMWIFHIICESESEKAICTLGQWRNCVLQCEWTKAMHAKQEWHETDSWNVDLASVKSVIGLKTNLLLSVLVWHIRLGFLASTAGWRFVGTVAILDLMTAIHTFSDWISSLADFLQ